MGPMTTGSRGASFMTVATIERDFMDALPFPVAYPLALAIDESSAAADRSADNLVTTAEQTLRVSALVLLADYLASDVRSPKVDMQISGLRMPHWQQWRDLARALAKHWRGHYPDHAPDRPSHFPALVDGWLSFDYPGKRERVDWQDLLLDLPGSSGPATSACDALHKLRNDRAHRGGIRDDQSADRDAALVNRMLPVLTAGLRRLFPPGELRLVRRATSSPATVFELSGPRRDFCFPTAPIDEKWLGLFSETPLAAFGREGGVPLYPLAAPPASEGFSGEFADGGLTEPALLLHSVTGQYVVMVGLRGTEDRDDLLPAFHTAVARKGVDFSNGRDAADRWDLVGPSVRHAREMLEEHHDRTYFPSCYVERDEADGALVRILDRPGKAVLVIGEAGSGKTSLLARLVDRLCTGGAEGAPNDVVLFVSGRGSYSADVSLGADALLCAAITRRAGLRTNEFSDLEDFARRLAETAEQDNDQDRRVWIVLDALNEADRFEELAAALDRFLPNLGRYPWLRLVASLRRSEFDRLQRKHVESTHQGPWFISNHRWLWEFESERGTTAPYLELRRFDIERHGRAAYEMRQRYLAADACPVPYDELSSRLRHLLRLPLHLDLFHSAFRGTSAIDPEMDEWRLHEAYLERVRRDRPGCRQPLEAISRSMLERRSPELPLDVAETWLQEWRRRKPAGGIDPIEELVSAGILRRPPAVGFGETTESLAFSFRHRRLCELALLDEVRRHIAPREIPTGADLLAWAARTVPDKSGDVFTELLGSLEILCTLAVRKGEVGAITSLLEVENDSVRGALLVATLRELGRAWGTSEAGAPLARKALNQLVIAARDDDTRSLRLTTALGEASEWLSNRGRDYAASALADREAGLLRRLGGVRAEGSTTLPVALARHEAALRRLGQEKRADTVFEDRLRILQHRYLETRADDAKTQLAAALADDLTAADLTASGLTLDLVRNDPDDIREILLGSRLARLGNETLRELAAANAATHAAVQDAREHDDLEQLRRQVADEPDRVDLRLELARRVADDQALGVYRDLIARVPHRIDVKREFAQRLTELGTLGGDGARSHLHEALEVCRAAREDIPEDDGLRRSYHRVLLRLLKCDHEAGRASDWLSWFRTFLLDLRAGAGGMDISSVIDLRESLSDERTIDGGLDPGSLFEAWSTQAAKLWAARGATDDLALLDELAKAHDLLEHYETMGDEALEAMEDLASEAEAEERWALTEAMRGLDALARREDGDPDDA